MRVLITGASGLIGTALSEDLARDGHTVITAVRRPAREGEMQWNPGGSRFPDVDGFDAVIHLAGAGIGDKRWTPARKQQILDSRTHPTRILAEAVARAVPHPVLLSASAIGYYGDRGQEVLTEATPPGTDFFAEVCKQWEANTRPAAEAGARVVTMRSGIVLTPKGGALSRMLLPFKLGLGGRFGPGDQYMSWISLTDEIRAIRFLLDSDISGPVNLTAPNPVTNRDFTNTLGDVLNRPTLLPTPVFGVKLVYGSEMVELTLLGSQRVIGTVLEDNGFAFEHEKLRGALQAAIG
jgi:uncharacterized protein (TIGR01777 family)